MKSIKPGRGPSMMGGVMAIFAVLFGILWTLITISFGAGFMAIFGLIFICIGIFNAIYNFKNATGENRYSAYDIVDESEEPDPLNEKFGRQEVPTENNIDDDVKFCPYCGVKVSSDFEYCHKCGKKLP